jgi:cytochrome c oxidase assembly factor CtaG
MRITYRCSADFYALAQNRRRLSSYLLELLLQEIVMTSSCIRNSISRAVIAAAVVAMEVSWANAALASQGPGGGMGTAGHLTQVAMAILVYGAAALVVGFGLIGAVRGR